MEFIFGLLLGMLVATLAIRWFAQKAIAKLLKQIEEDSAPEIDNQLRVEVEFEQNIYFLYNSDDGSFVAQGANVFDLRNNLRKRFPNSTITIVKGNAAAMENLQQHLKDFDENSHSVGSAS